MLDGCIKETPPGGGGVNPVATWGRALQTESSVSRKDPCTGACLCRQGWITEEGSQVEGRVMSGVGEDIRSRRKWVAFALGPSRTLTFTLCEMRVLEDFEQRNGVICFTF